MHTPSTIAATALAAALFVAPAAAGERRFTFTYESTTAPKGLLELEQFVTYKGYGNRDRFEFRTEIEYGITDRLQLGVYLSDWRHTVNKNAPDKTEWRTAGVEAIYAMTDPNTSPLGSALYGEVLVGPEKVAVEAKLLLQKNAGPWVFAYNAVAEAEWEGEDLDEEKLVLGNTLGASYQFNPHFLAGVEAVHEVEFADWSDAGPHLFYFGPNISLRGNDCFLTLTALWQITDESGEPDQMVRMLAGIHF